MTKEQFEHVEEKLVEFVDHVIESCKEKRATSAEVEALPEVALALVEMHQFPHH